MRIVRILLYQSDENCRMKITPDLPRMIDDSTLQRIFHLCFLDPPRDFRERDFFID